MCATKVRSKNAPPVDVSAELDRTDKAILRQLQRDASLSNVALAEKVHLSPPACLRALTIPRDAARAHALRYSWDASAQQFISNVKKAQAAQRTFGTAPREGVSARP